MNRKLLVAAALSCTTCEDTSTFEPVSVINLPCNQKLVGMMTHAVQTITRPMRKGEFAESYQIMEHAKWVTPSSLIIHECVSMKP